MWPELYTYLEREGRKDGHSGFFLNKKRVETMMCPSQVLHKVEDIPVPHGVHITTTELSVSKKQLILYTI